MLRPSFQRRMPPVDMACFGGSLMPSMNIMPLTRWTSRSPATPVPYSFQQRQRAKMQRIERSLRARRPAMCPSRAFCGERSGGGGYCHAPVGIVAAERAFDEHQVAEHALAMISWPLRRCWSSRAASRSARCARSSFARRPSRRLPRRCGTSAFRSRCPCPHLPRR